MKKVFLHATVEKYIVMMCPYLAFLEIWICVRVGGASEAAVTRLRFAGRVSLIETDGPPVESRHVKFACVRSGDVGRSPRTDACRRTHAVGSTK